MAGADRHRDGQLLRPGLHHGLVLSAAVPKLDRDNVVVEPYLEKLS